MLGDEFTGYSGGAMWEDTKVGVENWTHWERIAVVSDHKVDIDGVKVFGWLVPGKVKTFAVAELDDAPHLDHRLTGVLRPAVVTQAPTDARLAGRGSDERSQPRRGPSQVASTRPLTRACRRGLPESAVPTRSDRLR